MTKVGPPGLVLWSHLQWGSARPRRGDMGHFGVLVVSPEQDMG